MKTIKGITWDHPRGFDSIVAATEEYHKISDTCRIKWDARSLSDFGDLPLSALVDHYDLLIIDHPFVGEAHAKKLLVPLENLLSYEFLEQQSQLQVGPCYASYSFSGHQYALPVDASAQFCVLNPKLLNWDSTPGDWDEFLELLEDRGFKKKVLWPLCPTDLWCSFLTLAAQLAKKTSAKVFDDQGLNIAISSEALDLLKRLIEGIPSQCFNLNPIQVLDILSSQNEYALAPLIFGYNNYSRPGFGGLEFSNAIELKGEQTFVSAWRCRDCAFIKEQ